MYPYTKNTSEYTRSVGNVHTHRRIAEEVLGRKLKGKELVHHVDGNRANNEKSNLVICPDAKYHKLLHSRQRIADMGGKPDVDKYCSYHKQLHNRSSFSTCPIKYDGLHNTCRDATNEYRKNNGLNVDKFDWKARLNQQYRRLLKGYTSGKVSWLT